MTTVLTVVGARPQFIKAATISRAFARHGPAVRELLVHTGQHYDANMSGLFFDELELPAPSINLGIGGGPHGQNTGRMLEKLEAVMLEARPDIVLVYGDTDSTLAGALAAVKLHIPLAHVEAGLRSHNRHMPEEINRVLTDHASDVLFPPTAAARDNLLHEGLRQRRIHVFGDVMYDAVLHYRRLARKPSWFGDLQAQDGEFALCTVHRAENTDDTTRLRNIVAALASCPVPVVMPLHPRTRSSMLEAGLSWPDKVHAVEPVGYLEMVWLESNCKFVLTDSGGVQKEAFFHRKPCITLRDETEWVELVAAGWNQVVGTDPERISSAMAAIATPSEAPALYGAGDAAARIVDSLV